MAMEKVNPQQGLCQHWSALLNTLQSVMSITVTALNSTENGPFRNIKSMFHYSNLEIVLNQKHPLPDGGSKEGQEQRMRVLQGLFIQLDSGCLAHRHATSLCTVDVQGTK
jgi:hypothetical protein